MTNKIPRVTFLITRLARGGAENQLMYLATRLKTNGWDTHVISMQDPLEVNTSITKENIPVSSFSIKNPGSLVTALPRAISFFRETKPDILVTFLYHANIFGRMAGRIAGIPHIVSSIRNEKFGKRSRELVERGTSHMSKAVVVNSSIAADRLVERKICRRGRMEVIANGIDKEEFVVGVHDEMKQSPEFLMGVDRFLWISVGHLYPQKNHKNLILAVKRLVDKGLAVSLIIVGEGPLRKRLEELLYQLNLNNHICFLGLRKDVQRLLSKADGFVLSSDWEGMPNSLMEAMILEKPVVATRVGGVPELVKDRVTGYLVPAREVDQLAQAMESVMKLPIEYRKEFGAAGKSHIVENYGIDRMVNDWTQLLCRFLTAEQKSVLKCSPLQSSSGANAKI